MTRAVTSYLEELEARGVSLRLRKNSLYGLEWLMVYLREQYRVEDWRAVMEAHLWAFVVHLQRDHRTRRGERLKARTVSMLAGVVRGFFGWQHKRGHLIYNPAEQILLPRSEYPLPHVLNEEEISRLIEMPDITTAIGLRDRAMMEVLYATGIRHGEAHRLDLYDVDTRTRRLVVRLGKVQKDRIVPMTENAAYWLVEYLSKARAELAAGQKKNGSRAAIPTNAVWLARTGQRLSYPMIEIRIKRYAREAKLRANVHTFRHSCATHLLRNGAGIRYIQQLLGHSNLHATEIYLHLDIEDLKRAVASLPQTTLKP
jgi:integrase/recombinase XerD